jgi:hypothetical protein
VEGFGRSRPLGGRAPSPSAAGGVAGPIGGSGPPRSSGARPCLGARRAEPSVNAGAAASQRIERPPHPASPAF